MKWKRLSALIACIAVALALVGTLAFWSARSDARDVSLLGDIGYARASVDASLATMRRADFAPVNAYFMGGYDNAAHWFRMRLRPPPNGGAVVLSVAPTFLDSVELYSTKGGGVWEKQENGDLVPVEQRDWKGPGLGFLVDPREDGSIYYLRVTTSSTAEVFLWARPLKNELVHANQRMSLHLLLFAVMALGVVLACLQAFYRPDGASFLLVLCSASYLFYSIFMLGYPAVANPGLSASVLARIPDVLYIVIGVLTLLFHRKFLEPLKPLPITVLAVDLLALGCAATFVIYVSGYETLAFAAVSTISFLTAPTVLALAWTTRTAAQSSLPSVRFYYTLFGIFIAVTMLANLGVLPAVPFHRYSVEIYGLLNVTLVLSLVVSRWWSGERKLAATKARLRDSELRQEMKARSAQLKDNLLNMLVHEVRNHLSVIQLSVSTAFNDADRDEAETVVRDLERLILDCQRFSRLERGVWIAQPAETDLVALVFETLADMKDEERFEVDFDQPATVTTDAQMLMIALASLVAEVSVMAAKDSPVELHVVQQGSFWTIRVSATGTALWPVPLTLASATASAANRSSLSLAVAKGIVEVLGGGLTIVNRGNQIRCDITLPSRSALQSSKTTGT